MLENTPNQPNSNPNEYDPVQASLQYMQQQLAEQGIDVTPQSALQLHVQKTSHDAERWVQQDLTEQGITVSPEEAPTLFWQKHMHNFKREIQQDLTEQGIDVSLDEAVAINWLRTIHHVMEHTVTTDP